MKIHAIQTNHFLGARAVDVRLTKPVALFAGKNFAGKSSLQEAVRMALTGESVRVGLKKEYGALVTEGQESGFVEVTTADAAYSVVLPAGKGVHCENTALPYVLDAQRFARLGDNERRAFLLGLMGVKMDGATVKQRLLGRGFDEKRVEQVLPLLRAGFDAAQKEAAAKARDAKASWKTTTGGETWGKDKAAKWQPAPLPADAEKAEARQENALALMKATEQDLGAAQQELGAARAKDQSRRQQAAQRDELAEKAGRIDRIKAKLGRDEADVVQWQAKVDETRAKAGAVPVNPAAPGEYLLRGLASVTRDFLDLSTRYQLIDKETDEVRCFDQDLVMRASTSLAEFVKAHGEQNSAADRDPEAVARLPEYEQALALVQSAVANDKRDLSAAEQAAARLKEIDAEAGESIDLEPLQAKVAELTGKRDAWREDASKYRALADQASRRQGIIEQAAALHADVMAWTDIADALAPDGIPGEMLAEALTPLNERLTESSELSEWPDVTVTRDMEILAGGRAYALLSESEKWRADAMIAEAVANLSGLKLLVLDRFDVLDLKGREDLLYWLDELAEHGEIDTALVFGTLKGIPAQLPATVAGFWIENGTAGQMKEAA